MSSIYKKNTQIHTTISTVNVIDLQLVKKTIHLEYFRIRLRDNVLFLVKENDLLLDIRLNKRIKFTGR